MADIEQVTTAVGRERRTRRFFPRWGGEQFEVIEVLDDGKKVVVDRFSDDREATRISEQLTDRAIAGAAMRALGIGIGANG